MAGDDWEGARTSAHSKLHVLQKVAIDLKLKKSLLPHDTRLPALVDLIACQLSVTYHCDRLIVEGALPDLHFSLSDKKVEQIIKVRSPQVVIISAMLLMLFRLH